MVRSEAVKPIPEGFHTVTPQLVCANALQALEFYKNALGAEILRVAKDHSGKVMHADFKIGDSMVMLSDEYPDSDCRSQRSLGGTDVTLHIYTPDADAAFAKAVKTGAKVTRPLMDAFWGDRYGQVEDPYEHRWSMATRKRVRTEEEIRSAMKAFAEKSKEKSASG